MRAKSVNFQEKRSERPGDGSQPCDVAAGACLARARGKRQLCNHSTRFALVAVPPHQVSAPIDSCVLLTHPGA